METAQIDDLIARLAKNPERVAAAVEGWSEAQLRAPTADGGWSVAQVFAHMRAADDIWTPRILMVLVRDQPLLAGYDERHWEEVAGYAQADFQLSLRTFRLRRAELVSLLRRVPPGDWQRVGRHEALGPLALHAVVARLLEHEDEHCAQLEAQGR